MAFWSFMETGRKKVMPRSDEILWKKDMKRDVGDRKTMYEKGLLDGLRIVHVVFVQK